MQGRSSSLSRLIVAVLTWAKNYSRTMFHTYIYQRSLSQLPYGDEEETSWMARSVVQYYGGWGCSHGSMCVGVCIVVGKRRSMPGLGHLSDSTKACSDTSDTVTTVPGRNCPESEPETCFHSGLRPDNLMCCVQKLSCVRPSLLLPRNFTPGPEF